MAHSIFPQVTDKRIFDMSTVTIDVATERALVDDPGSGHNRWHPNIEPLATCRSGDEILVSTRDALDGQLGPQSTSEDISSVDVGRIHPLSGPLWVDGAEPGDILEIQILDVSAPEYGFTSQRPGLGLLSGDAIAPYLVHWYLDDACARSEQLPDVEVPGAPFLGIIGVAPSAASLQVETRRESETTRPPTNPTSAIPASDEICQHGLRTGPPRHNGGNIDIRQLTAGSSLFLPVWERGALVSVGDAHFAQGDGEVCGTAIEMRSESRFRVIVHSKSSSRNPIRSISFFAPQDPRPVPAMFGVMGLPTEFGHGRLWSAAVAAVTELAERLADAYGFEFQAAYALCSVTAHLSVSQLVNEPNVSVTASVPLDVFGDSGRRLLDRGMFL